MAIFQNSVLKKYLSAQPKLKMFLGELTEVKNKLSLPEGVEWIAYFNDKNTKPNPSNPTSYTSTLEV